MGIVLYFVGAVAGLLTSSFDDVIPSHYLFIGKWFFVFCYIFASSNLVITTLLGLVDGLVQRDIRRWSGGRESSFIYHWAKKFVLPSLILPWILYLSMPFSVHPNLIVLPFAMLLSLSIAVMASTFKKYL